MKEVKKMIKNEKTISIIIGSVIILTVVISAVLFKNKGSFSKNTVDVYAAVGGGKEDLLADSEINKVFDNKYHFKLVNDTWSNGKTVKIPVLRENNEMYDLIFFILLL